jgi:hypothetical protein
MTAYNELFKSVTNTAAVDSDNTLLDYLREQEARRLKDLVGAERDKISGHVDSIESIRERNAKVAALGEVIASNLPTIDPVHADGGSNATLVQKQEAFTDVIAAAMISGLTNVVTYTIDDLGVVAAVGFGGHNMQDKFLRILNAQMAVGDVKRHPEFAGTVASVDTRDFWREVDESPTNQDYHYNRNAETYMLVGDALGRAMVGLLGGKAEPLPQAPRPKRVVAQQTTEPSAEETAAAQIALKPIILDGIAASHVADPRYSKSLLEEATGQRPPRPNQFLNDTMYGLVQFTSLLRVRSWCFYPTTAWSQARNSGRRPTRIGV